MTISLPSVRIGRASRAIPHIISSEQQTMVVVEGWRLFCWACKQLGHIARTCPQKTAAIKNHQHHTQHQNYHQHNLIFSTGTRVPSRQPRKRMDSGYQKKKDKLSSHISSYNTSRRNNSSKSTTAPETTTDSTTTQPSSPRKTKKKWGGDHRGGTAGGDGNLSKL